MEATLQDNFFLVESLLKTKVEVDVEFRGFSALHFAIERENFQIFKLFLKFYRRDTKFKVNPLLLSVENKRTKIFKSLIKKFSLFSEEVLEKAVSFSKIKFVKV